MVLFNRLPKNFALLPRLGGVVGMGLTQSPRELLPPRRAQRSHPVGVDSW